MSPSTNKPAAQRRFEQGLALHEQGKQRQAQKRFEQAIKVQPNHFDALLFLGSYAYQDGKSARAGNLFRKAARANPESAQAFYNWGLCCSDAGDHARAIDCYDRAVALDASYANAYNNRGVAHQARGDYIAAVRDHEQALAISPGHLQALNNLGMAREKLGDFDGAIECYERALAINPQLAEVLKNQGNSLVALGQHLRATECFDRAMAVNPDVDYLQGTRLRTNLQLCRWKDFDAEVEQLSQRIAQDDRAASPLTTLLVLDSLPLQRAAATTWSREMLPQSTWTDREREPGRIRVGYYSADFREHPVAYLAAELFELHDRELFEVVGFYFGPKTDDDMHSRIAAACDRFYDVASKSDAEIVSLSREVGIDIAVDLGGYTDGSRTRLFGYRMAPVQVSYLGYLGTLGTDAFDFIFADRVLVPESSAQHYAENIAWLPSYQVNDRQRPVGERRFSRAELGLPEQGFVFCCFNNSYKITPFVFDSWMRILAAVEGSVLFLNSDNKSCEENLQREADARGVDPARLVFSGRLPRDEYIARYRVADLFLDTLPYNAGTTASDALWAGLPVLTCAGESSAARIAASLLTAVGLPELITDSLADYEACAIRLATHAGELAGIREALDRNRSDHALFDTPRCVKNIERGYLEMNNQRVIGEGFESLVVTDDD